MKKLKQPYFLFVVVCGFLGLGVSLALLNRGHAQFGNTAYDNYLIFKQSFVHLIYGQNIYDYFKTEHADLFKYSPTFALFMAPFAYMPTWLGLVIWNILGSVLLAIAVKPYIHGHKLQLLAMLLLLTELATNNFSCQTNSYIAALVVYSYTAIRQSKFYLSALCLALAVLIKPFALVFYLFYFLYPRQLFRNLSIVVVLAVGLILLPALFIGLPQLWLLYKHFGQRIALDHGEFVKLSFTAWFNTWFGTSLSSTLLLIVGFALQLGSSILCFKYKKHTLLLAQWLLWVVLFNHMAESSTYIIAVTGVVLWLINTQMSLKTQWILAILVLVFTCLGPTDLFPKHTRELLVYVYQLKAFACIAVWFAALTETFLPDFRKS